MSDNARIASRSILYLSIKRSILYQSIKRSISHPSCHFAVYERMFSIKVVEDE